MQPIPPAGREPAGKLLHALNTFPAWRKPENVFAIGPDLA